jgi:zinc D-Ala-D-Ala dipeptidase
MSIDRKKMLTLKDLLEVPVGEIGSPMVNLGEMMPELRINPVKVDMRPYTGDDIYVRQEVADGLRLAYKILQDKLAGASFEVRYGYRHPEVQRSYYEKRYAFFKEDQSNLSPQSLIELAHTQVAVPEVAGHPAGAALDLSLINRDSELIDMGMEIADYSEPEKCFTYSNAISEQQQANRLLLADVMLEAGFAPYNGEWWHFSYGDREWARFYEQPQSLFDQIDFRPKKKGG